MKRISAFILAMLMIFSIFPMSVFAEGPEEVMEEEKALEEISFEKKEDDGRIVLEKSDAPVSLPEFYTGVKEGAQASVNSFSNEAEIEELYFFRFTEEEGIVLEDCIPYGTNGCFAAVLLSDVELSSWQYDGDCLWFYDVVSSPERARWEGVNYAYFLYFMVPDNYSADYCVEYLNFSFLANRTRYDSGYWRYYSDVFLMDPETVCYCANNEEPMYITTPAYSAYLTKEYGYSNYSRIDIAYGWAIDTATFRSIAGKSLQVQVGDFLSVYFPEISSGQQGLNFWGRTLNKYQEGLGFQFYDTTSLAENVSIEWDPDMTYSDLRDYFYPNPGQPTVVTYYCLRDGSYFDRFTVDYSKVDGERAVFIEIALKEGDWLGEFQIVMAAPTEDDSILDCGYCGGIGDGKNLFWTLTTDGTLTVEGEGPMMDYETYWDENGLNFLMPWSAYRENITALSVEEGVTRIGTWAFAYMDSLTEISLPDSVEEIGYAAFIRNGLSGTLTLPENLKIIEDSAFEHASFSGHLEIPEGTLFIGFAAFHSVPIESVTIPASVEEMYAPFLYCDKLKTVKIDAGNPYFSVKDGAIFNKSKTTLVEVLPWKTNFTIPSTVTTIGEYAFCGCLAFETPVVIPSSVRFINDCAFDNTNCFMERMAVIPAGVQQIGWYAFENCGTQLFRFLGDAPECDDTGFDADAILFYTEGKKGWTTPEWNGFAAYPYKEIVLPEDAVDGGICGVDLTWVLGKDGTLTIEGTGAMFNYSEVQADERWLTTAPWGIYEKDIKKLVFEEGVTTIGNNAFDGMSDMAAELILPESLESILYSAFYDCNSLTNTDLVIPDNVTTIEDWAFGFVPLDTVYLGKNTEPVGNGGNPFRSNWIKNFVVDEGNPYSCAVDGVLFSKDKKMLYAYPGARTGSYAIPEGTVTIFYCAFENCAGNFTFPSTLKTVGIGAFAYTHWTGDIKIPSNVKEILGFAFTYCSVDGKVIVDSTSDMVIDNNAFLKQKKVYFTGNAPTVVEAGVEQSSFDPDTTLYYLKGKTGWTTPTWNGYQTEVWDGVIYGDVNGDGAINVIDANLARRAAAKALTLDDNQKKAADVDGNGSVNVIDANLIRRYAAKLITKFPVEG